MILLTILSQRILSTFNPFSFAQLAAEDALSFILSHNPSDKYILSSPISSHASEIICFFVYVGSYSSAIIARNESAPLLFDDLSPLSF